MQDTPIVEPIDPAEPYQQALRLIKDGRWTEAKRKLDEIDSVSPGYRDVAKLQVMVDEVLPISRYGFGMPAHVVAATQERMESARVEEPEPYVAPTRRTSPLRWMLPVAGLVVIVILVVVLTR